MERTIYALAQVDAQLLERIWDHCQNQGRDIPMYKMRLCGYINWVVALDSSPEQTRFLLEFSDHVTQINQPCS
jgi:hypothetical protein